MLSEKEPQIKFELSKQECKESSVFSRSMTGKEWKKCHTFTSVPEKDKHKLKTRHSKCWLLSLNSLPDLSPSLQYSS